MALFLLISSFFFPYIFFFLCTVSFVSPLTLVCWHHSSSVTSPRLPLFFHVLGLVERLFFWHFLFFLVLICVVSSLFIVLSLIFLLKRCSDPSIILCILSSNTTTPTTTPMPLYPAKLRPSPGGKIFACVPSRLLEVVDAATRRAGTDGDKSPLPALSPETG